MPVTTEDLGDQIDGVTSTFITQPRQLGTVTVYYQGNPVAGVIEGGGAGDEPNITLILPFVPQVGQALTATYTVFVVPTNYCTIEDIRNEGFPDTVVSDDRLNTIIPQASRYIEKMTGRWFYPDTFYLQNPPAGWTPQPNNFSADQNGNSIYTTPCQLNLLPGDRPYRMNGNGVRELTLDIPVIRLDFLGIENQAFLFAQLTWIELDAVRVYNRANQEGVIGGGDDDRENPRIGFTVAGRIVETIASGLYPAPRIFPRGRLNIMLFGVFGYTDYDPSGQNPLGVTPPLIQVACKRLVERDLLQDASICEKLNMQNLYRVTSDSDSGTSVSLSDLWLKGRFTGNPEIDSILVAYQRPVKIGIA